VSDPQKRFNEKQKDGKRFFSEISIRN